VTVRGTLTGYARSKCPGGRGSLTSAQRVAAIPCRE
jgi:hypothetical protein